MCACVGIEKGANMQEENLHRMEAFSFREQRIANAHRRLKIIKREHPEPPNAPTSPATTDSEGEMDCMTLSEAAKKWLKQHGLEGFLRIMEAPPHKEAERVVKAIDTEVITEEAIRALTGLPEGGIFTIDNPTPEQLTKYFGEYSLASKAYRTQGGEDGLFREIARVLHEFGHVYPRPPAMPRNRAGLIIATYEGIQVDWSVLIADGLRAAIDSVRGKDGRKIWSAMAQWLTLLAPPVEPITAKKRGRSTEGTPKTASKRQQLLAAKATKGKEADTEKTAKERPNQAETQEATPARPIKITFRRPGQQEPDPLAMKINLGTQEEETAEEPSEHLQRRQKKSTADHAGKQSGPEKDRTPIPRTEGPEPRVESEPVRTEPVTEFPTYQATTAGQDITRPVIQEPVIQLSTPPAHQDQPEPERPTEAQPEPELPSGNQPEPELPTRQDQPLASAEIGQPSAWTQQQGTDSQWLRWIGEQIAGVVHYMEAEERAQLDRLLATTGELEKARSRIRSLEQELEIATEELAKMVITGPQEQEPVAPVHVQNNETPTTVHNNTTPVTETIPDTITAQAQELAVLKEDLAAQEALRARERELKMAAEEEQRKTADNLRRAEESLRKGHQAYDRLKEEKEKVLQEKDKLRRMAETEIERLKEELRQQKDREDRARRQINQKLKQKTEDFDRLHRDYKHVETEYKKLITDSDQ